MYLFMGIIAKFLVAIMKVIVVIFGSICRKLVIPGKYINKWLSYFGNDLWRKHLAKEGLKDFGDPVFLGTELSGPLIPAPRA